jgi:acyl-coenzyme A synthetase/AMP-(fatty) acid ligase
VGECAVIAVDTDGFEGAAICCAYAPVAGTNPTPTRLRRALSTLIPSYMLPSRWLAFDQLPQNASGKIDRVRLKSLFERELDTYAAQAS